MAFSSAIKGTVQGINKKISFGTWTSGSTTGGDIKTGLAVVESIVLVPNKTAVATNQCVVNETLPIKDGITIVTDSGVDGYWQAIGY